MSIDFRAIKSQYSLQDIVPGLLGQNPGTLHGRDADSYFQVMHNRMLGNHAGHDVYSPSLTIYPDHAYCFGCGYQGDIFDIIRDVMMFDTNAEVAEYLTHGGYSTSRVPISARAKRIYEIKPQFPLSNLGLWHDRMQPPERAKWHDRGFSGTTIDQFKLGYIYGDHPLYGHRLVIPNPNHVGVYSAKLRRDDDWAYADMLSKGDEWLADNLQILNEERRMRLNAEHVEDASLVDLMNKHYKRYVWLKGGTVWFTYEELLMQAQPYLFVTSSETDAIAMSQAGLKTICWPADGGGFPEPEDGIHFHWKGKVHKFDVRYLFRRVAAIFWVGDNDSSGKKSAETRRRILDRGEVTFVPREKDPAAYFASGGTVKEWLPSLWKVISR